MWKDFFFRLTRPSLSPPDQKVLVIQKVKQISNIGPIFQLTVSKCEERTKKTEEKGENFLMKNESSFQFVSNLSIKASRYLWQMAVKKKDKKKEKKSIRISVFSWRVKIKSEIESHRYVSPFRCWGWLNGCLRKIFRHFFLFISYDKFGFTSIFSLSFRFVSFSSLTRKICDNPTHIVMQVKGYINGW